MKIKFVWSVICALFLIGCGLSGNVVTMDSFSNVDLCTTVDQVKACLGDPYAINEIGDGCLEYEYIERIPIGARNLEERHYYIVIKDVYVVSKRIKQSSITPLGPLPLNFDSYEMQTTLNE